MKAILIGLGGSGGKIIRDLLTIMKEKHSDPALLKALAIDTDINQLNDLQGVEKMEINTGVTVGELVATLGKDVDTWCPIDGESVFLSSSLDNGASQCRFKSRLCLAGTLVSPTNLLTSFLDSIMTAGVRNPNEVIRIMICSSIAGGTGSGIFIPVALFIKKYLRERYSVSNPSIHGLFACPDIYTDVVPAQQHRKLFANAYAVIRELNAFNLCSSDKVTNEYGRNIDIEVSSACEGNLFSKDNRGRYTDKPYDSLYFIDKVNAYSAHYGEIDNYYRAMAEIAYTHLLSPVAQDSLSNESNELAAQSAAPNAIYGSAGTAVMEYPIGTVLQYLAARMVRENITPEVWMHFDRQWHDYVRQQSIAARSEGLDAYRPEPGERGRKYIDEYLSDIYQNLDVFEQSRLEFLQPMVDLSNDPVDALLNKIKEYALEMVKADRMLTDYRAAHNITAAKITQSITSVTQKIANGEIDGNLFAPVETIDSALAAYLPFALTKVKSMAITLANNIFCTNRELWDECDKSGISVRRALLMRGDTFIHPLAARFLLYRFAEAIEKKLTEAGSAKLSDPGAVLRTTNSKVTAAVDKHAVVLDDVDDGVDMKNTTLLEDAVKSGKKKVLARVQEALNGKYRDSVLNTLKVIDQSTADALVSIALLKVYAGLSRLIGQYESFFDHLPDYLGNLNASVVSLETGGSSDPSKIYVGASAAAKRTAYDQVCSLMGGGDQLSGETSQALFVTIRNMVNWETDASPFGQNNAEVEGAAEFLKQVTQSYEEHLRSNEAVMRALSKDAFTALIEDYAAQSSECRKDLEIYTKDPSARSRIQSFIEDRFQDLAYRAAPMLIYDDTDPYAPYARSAVDKALQRKNTTYRYFVHSQTVLDSIDRYFNTPGASFYSVLAQKLPKDPSLSVTPVSYSIDNIGTDYTIVCHTAVHCLQPYQIRSMNEENGGKYYTEYAALIHDIETGTELLSSSPHLDKRWHKRGHMPYVNVKKEKQAREDLVKAFLYALLTRRILRIDLDSGRNNYQFYDKQFCPNATRIQYKGRLAQGEQIAKLLYWLSDSEAIIEDYAEKYDTSFAALTEHFSAVSMPAGQFESLLTRDKCITRLRTAIVSRGAYDVSLSDSGRALSAWKPYGILKAAVLLKESEEHEVDFDYAEVVLQLLMGILENAAAAQVSAEGIRDENSDEYAYFAHVYNQQVVKFILQYLEDEGYTVKMSGGVVVSAAKKGRKAAAEEELFAGQSSAAAPAAQDEDPDDLFGGSSASMGAALEDGTFSSLIADPQLASDKNVRWLLANLKKKPVEE